MRVVLRTDVDGIGRRGDIREVAAGYARNYLLPRGLAIRATAGVEAQAEAMRRARALKHAAEIADARVVVERLQSAPVRISVRAGKEGKLFGSVTTAEIASAIERQLGATIERRHIELAEPIKALGNYEVAVAIHPDARGTVNVHVVAS